MAKAKVRFEFEIDTIPTVDSLADFVDTVRNAPDGIALEDAKGNEIDDTLELVKAEVVTFEEVAVSIL